MISQSASVRRVTAIESRLQEGWGIVAFAILVFVMVALSWEGLVSLPEAWSRDEYSYGWLIPPIALFLFLRAYHSVEPPVNRGSRWPGFAVSFFGILVTLAGDITNIPDVVTYGLIIWIGGIVLLSFGWRYGLRFWVPVFYLIFMLPLPNFLFWKLSISLQIMSSEIGVGMIRTLGVPVFLEGNVIDLGVFKLQVAEACSGLRYLFPLTSFSFLFAVLYRGPVWQKFILVLSAGPITILMNSFRIGMIGLLVDRWGIEQANGFLHLFEGWVIFAASIAVLFLECVLLQRISRDRRRLADTLDLDPVPVIGPSRRMLSMPLSGALVSITLVAALITSAYYFAPARAVERVERDPLAIYPLRIGAWRGTSDLLDPAVENVLKADDYIDATYVSSDGRPPVNLFVAYYFSQTSGAGIHSPEVCIPVGGWEVSEWKSRTMSLETPQGTEIVNFNRAIIQRGLNRQLVYYWFEQRGRRLDNDFASKAYTMLDSATRGRSDGALVRFVTNIHSNEETADARLREFIGLNLQTLPRFVPK
ncbi:MAG: VPLPA-CTERM-specific exosortase XrtD [Paracoccaceae bacterium]